MKTKRSLNNASNLFQRLPPNARILLIRLRSFGDCLLLTSSIRGVKQEFPSFRLSVLVESRFADVYRGNPDIEEVIPAGDSKLKTLLRLMTRHYHAILNLHGGPTSAVYALAAVGRRYGAGQYQYPWLYHGLVPPPRADAHTAETNLDWFTAMGLHVTAPPPLRFERQPDAALSIQKATLGARYVVIHPAALMETKRWPAARFREVALRLQKDCRVVLTCGPGEEGVVSQIAANLRDATVLFGLTIPELAELIRGAEFYIGNDSGPMHLAAAVGTPVIAVWGSSESRRWRPWGIPHEVVQNPFECNPCAGYRCEVADHPLCIESVTVDQVMLSIERLRKKQNGKAHSARTVTH